MVNLLNALCDEMLGEGKNLAELLGLWWAMLSERVVATSEEEGATFHSFVSQQAGRDVYTTADKRYLPGDCLDMNPGNMFIREEAAKGVAIQDLKWKMPCKLPLQLVFDRGLYLLAERLRFRKAHLRATEDQVGEVPRAISQHFANFEIFRTRDVASFRTFESWLQRAVIPLDWDYRVAPQAGARQDSFLARWAMATAGPCNIEVWGGFVALANQIGRLSQALQLCRNRLQFNPQDLPLLFVTATISQMAGELGTATACYQRILALVPDNSPALMALETMQTFSSAEAWYEYATRLVAEYQPEAGVESLKELVDKHPGFVAAYNDLGVLSLQKGNVSHGLEYLEEAARIAPENVEILKNLASVYQAQHRIAEYNEMERRLGVLTVGVEVPSSGSETAASDSVPSLTPRGFLRLGSDLNVEHQRAFFAERNALLGPWLGLSIDQFQAVYRTQLGPAYRRLVESEMRDEVVKEEDEALLSKLDLDLAQGDGAARARKQLAAVLFRRPHHWPVPNYLHDIPPWLLPDFLKYMLSSPLLFKEMGEAERYCEWLEKLVAAIQETVETLADQDLRGNIAATFANHANFIQAYFNDRNLRGLYRHRGQLLTVALGGSGTPLEWTFAMRESRAGGIRVGILASHLAPSAETFALLPLIEHLGSNFEVIVYCLSLVSEEMAGRLRKSRVTIHNLGRALSEQVKGIRADDLDILFFATNVTAVTNIPTALAVYRLARIQMTGPAAVTTTGLPNMDYYVSGMSSEPSPDAAAHYSERLVTITGASQCFANDASPSLCRMSPDRRHLGMESGDVVLASAANMFKLVPEVWRTWCEILERVPESKLFVLPFGPNWSKRYPKHGFGRMVAAVLKKRGIATNRILVADWPGLDRNDVRALLGVADIYLDAFPFGSTTSLIEPLEAGVPVVCWQGTSFRSAMGAAILRELGIPELVAKSKSAYVDLVERLARQREYRVAVKEKVAAAMRSRPTFLDGEKYGRAMARLFEAAFRNFPGNCDNRR
jgi:predicted O-linked N-acetylglucosamine transferase (SPINDLY family)